MKELFLDVNAHMPIVPKAMKALIDYNSSMSGHGHAMSPSIPGRAAANAIEEARTKIAELLKAKSSDQIVFTSGCTQACEWAVEIFKNYVEQHDLITYCSPTEHPAIKQSVDKLITNPVIMPIDTNGVIALCNHSVEESGFVCIHLQNELGIIQPIDTLNGRFLLSDMSQSAGKLSIDLSHLPVDVAIFGAHKFGGPVNLGFLYFKDTTNWKMFGTGSRYFFDRPGTPDVAAAVASASALEEAVNTLPERTQKMLEFRSVLEPGLKELGFDIVGENAQRCPNTTFVSMPNGLGFQLMTELGEHGIYVGLGSACGSAYTGASPLMKKLGRSGGPHDYMRISQFGNYASTEAKLFLDIIQKCMKKGKNERL